MKLIYGGWAGIKLAPDLAVDDVTESPSFGWLYAKHPDGQWVTLADLKPIFPSPDKLRADKARLEGELASKQADLETALNEMGKDDKELAYLNEQLDILRGKVRECVVEFSALINVDEIAMLDVLGRLREAVGND